VIWSPKPHDPERWIPWFAWYPVSLEDGRRVWLESVDYRMDHRDAYSICFEYRERK
jgi:hypothetical protein